MFRYHRPIPWVDTTYNTMGKSHVWMNTMGHLQYHGKINIMGGWIPWVDSIYNIMGKFHGWMDNMGRWIPWVDAIFHSDHFTPMIKRDTIFTCLFEEETSTRAELNCNMTQYFFLISNYIYSLMTSKTLTTNGPYHNHGLTWSDWKMASTHGIHLPMLSIHPWNLPMVL